MQSTYAAYPIMHVLTYPGPCVCVPVYLCVNHGHEPWKTAELTDTPLGKSTRSRAGSQGTVYEMAVRMGASW